MAKASGPDLRKYMEKKLSSAPPTSCLCHSSSAPSLGGAGCSRACRSGAAPPRPAPPSAPPALPSAPAARALTAARARAVKLNANRHVTGNLRGFDQFMNIVLDNTVEEVSETERNDIGLVVRRPAPAPRAWRSPLASSRTPAVLSWLVVGGAGDSGQRHRHDGVPG